MKVTACDLVTPHPLQSREVFAFLPRHTATSRHNPCCAWRCLDLALIPTSVTLQTSIPQVPSQLLQHNLVEAFGSRLGIVNFSLT
jgi:hypothetical protein